jgi:dihydrofolate synthase/folylpolyglutamate synthase
MNYRQTLDFLFSQLPMFQRTGAPAYKPGLGRILKLTELTGNPHKKGKYIHVAGTNGKGSTSHMLASILMEAGYKTGLFTSPHLLDFRERIKVNGHPISKQAVTYFVNKYSEQVIDIKPSFFEWTTALAFWWFEKQKCDISVIEVGMGGRLDSTNIITPVMSVITSISYDHMQFLGNTLSAIASEKAGIIKHGVPVVISTTQKEVKNVFEQKAQQENARIYFAEQHFKVPDILSSGNAFKAVVKTKKDAIVIPVGLGGSYQKRNIPGVLMAAELLPTYGISIENKHIKNGLRNVVKNTGLMGRWQIFSKKPLTILDTGHNPDGIKHVVEQAKSLKRNEAYYIFGTVNDKDMEKTFKQLPKSWIYLLVKPEVERGRNAFDLGIEFAKKGYKAVIFPDIKTAYKNACKMAKNRDLILVGGSTFVVADFLKNFK